MNSGKPPIRKGPPIRKPGVGSTGSSAPPQGGTGGAGKSRAPETTYEEVRYLKHLIENAVPVCVKLRDNEEVRGTIEYYDQSFFRLTREGAPNLFIYKHDIKYFYEVE